MNLNRSTRIVGVMLFLQLCISINAIAQRDSLRLLVIGNSFSQNATAYLPQMAKEQNKTLTIGRAELGGHSLAQHWGYVEAYEANHNDPKGKPYNGQSLKMLLSDGRWDVVSIQQFSYLSADSSSYHPYAEKLIAYIKKNQPDAKIIIHQTWAYRSDAKKFGKIGQDEFASSQKEMWQKSRAAYHRLAKAFNAKIFPVGDAFQMVATDKKYAYKKDLEFDFEHAAAPQLPNQSYSLNIGYFWNKSRLDFDPNHANNAGKYLGGLIWYAVLFNERPDKIDFRPESVEPEFAGYLKKVAKKVITE